MGKKSRERTRAARRKPVDPVVHVKVASTDSDLRIAASLVKPAILYADRVTIFSPAASLVAAVHELGQPKATGQKIDAFLQVAAEVPSLAEGLNIDETALTQLRAALSVDPKLLRGAVQGNRYRREMDEFLRTIQDFDQMWENEVPAAIEAAKASIGADELMAAVEAGAVEIAPMSEGNSSQMIADAVRAAEGTPTPRGLDEMMTTFLARIVEMVTETDSFPLLDADSSGLIRALENEAGLEPTPVPMRRSAEVTASAKLMGFLPYFPQLGMDEVLDLRAKLQSPLVRFRGAMAQLTRDFQKRSIDEGFDAEVEDAWRSRVAPALEDLREALHEHGLLQETASIAFGDPRRLLIEAGGVLAAAHAGALSLSGALAVAVTAAVPTTDVLLRALRNAHEARRSVRRESFYFLHRLRHEAERRSG